MFYHTLNDNCFIVGLLPLPYMCRLMKPLLVLFVFAFAFRSWNFFLVTQQVLIANAGYE